MCRSAQGSGNETVFSEDICQYEVQEVLLGELQPREPLKRDCTGEAG